MKPITLGHDANGKPLLLTPEHRRSTHMHVIGSSGTGKSKFLESMIRGDIRQGHGFCLLDWHGTLYDDVLRYCAKLDVGLFNDFRSLVLVNPSRPDYVTGFNPFMNTGADISTQVNRRIEATLRPWGVTNSDHMPTFERMCRLIYTFAVENGETLANAARLLDFGQPALRDYAVSTVGDDYIRSQWQQLQMIKTYKEWRDFVLSTENRFGRFLGSTSVRRFMGMEDGNIDLMDIMDNGKILLVNLGTSDFLDRDAAKTFASLFLNEFFETAMRRANRSGKTGPPSTFVLYLDEFQEYITEDVAAMLDQVRKGGLHLVLAHQHLAHLEEMPKLKDSVLTNARIRAVFGGLTYPSASELANEMFLPDLNTRQIKKAYYHTTHVYREETRTIHSKSTGHSSSHADSWNSGSGSSRGLTTTTGSGETLSGGVGWFEGTHSLSTSRSTASSGGSSDFSGEGGSDSETESDSEGESEVPVWVPIPREELSSEVEWSREEKVSKIAQMLKEQLQRHCFIKMDAEKTQPLRISFVKDSPGSEEALLAYEAEVGQAHGAIPAAEADRRFLASSQKFLMKVQGRTTASLEAPGSVRQEQVAQREARPGAKPETPWDNLRDSVGRDGPAKKPK